MEKTQELCFIKEEAVKCKNDKKLGIYEICVRGAAFLFARAGIIPGYAPFGAAFLSTERSLSPGTMVSAGCAALGYISMGRFSTAVKYISVLCAYLIFLAIAGREERISKTTAAFAVGIITVLADVGEMIWIGFSPGGVIGGLADGAMAVAFAAVFDKNRSLLHGGRSGLFTRNAEERLCLAAAAAIALIGFKNVTVGDFLSVSAALGLVIVMVFSVCGGIKYSVLTGAVVGILVGTPENTAEAIAAFTVCGLVGGTVSAFGKGKCAVCIAEAIAAVCMLLYSGELGAMVIGYADIPIAAAVVISMSEQFIRNIGRIAGLKTGKISEERCKEHIRSRLTGAADSFRTLAGTFLDLSDKHNTVDMEDISMMFDGTAERVCRECSRVSECWVNGFNATYKSMFKMLEIMERKGELCEEDADEHFAKKCLRLRAIVREMNRLFEIYKINCVWKSKLCENRELAGEQLASVAQILDNISDELYEGKIDAAAEEEIRQRIAAKGVEVYDLTIVIGANGRYGAYVCTEAEESDKCRRAAEVALKAVLGVKLVLMGATQTRDGGISMRFAQPEGYRVETGAAAVCQGENAECGDNCVMRYLSDGKYAAALSDGMGTGHRASRDSGATVTLLGDFLEAGFDKEVSVRLINSIMVMKSANEAFATVDMCVIDLFGGEAEFIKNGAEPSYIKHEKSTEVVRAASLPVGVMRDMEIQSFAHKLYDGDFVVMLSDGLQMKRGHADWIKQIIEEAERKMPAQELADRIMDMAKTLKGGKADDDMTVIVLKIHGR